MANVLLAHGIRSGDRVAIYLPMKPQRDHSYIIYGPLANGATTVMFESTPVYPDAGRYWRIVDQHRKILKIVN